SKDSSTHSSTLECVETVERGARPRPARMPPPTSADAEAPRSLDRRPDRDTGTGVPDGVTSRGDDETGPDLDSSPGRQCPDEMAGFGPGRVIRQRTAAGENTPPRPCRRCSKMDFLRAARSPRSYVRSLEVHFSC